MGSRTARPSGRHRRAPVAGASTITPLVKRLELAGFLTRQRNPDDERQVQVRLTPKGADIRVDTVCLTDTLLRRSVLTIEQMIALNQQVQALRDAVTGVEAG